ncbi:beta-ketoacyl reductase [Aspergillus tanneri]|uniref:Carrier domain-containing protein n=1 Tax=Aspergillus tanneri TaxID=1220188 RepID=A0A5M9MHR4_9EURO|nr:uncharacterized protein ATNIH1004_011412 [Aspergillus tanneri]KAA8642467.1 hypothetical protein ATNIH1004_011412 [Aspergillus tanneri]
MPTQQSGLTRHEFGQFICIHCMVFRRILPSNSEVFAHQRCSQSWLSHKFSPKLMYSEAKKRYTYLLDRYTVELCLPWSLQSCHRGTCLQESPAPLDFILQGGGTDAQEHLRRLCGLGCKAEAFACDTGDISSVESVQQLCKEQGWKIRGVVQCTMVLRDSTFENTTHQKWTESIQPKIYGSWNLHLVCGSQPLDFFIMLSSVSGGIGNPAQGNYTAGDSYQDGRAISTTARAAGYGACRRRSDGRNFLDKFEHLVAFTVKIEEVMIIFLQTLMKGKTEDGVTVPPLLAMGFTEQLKRDGNITSLWPKDRKFDHRVEFPENGDGESSGDKVRTANLLAQVADLDEAGKVVEEALKTNLANEMTASPEDVDADKPLHSYGVDSLKAVEVRNWLFRELKCDISVFDILSPIPLAKLSVNIAEKSKCLPDSLKRIDPLE